MQCAPSPCPVTCLRICISFVHNSQPAVLADDSFPSLELKIRMGVSSNLIQGPVYNVRSVKQLRFRCKNLPVVYASINLKYCLKPTEATRD